MPTQKEILASIDTRLADVPAIESGVVTLLDRTKPAGQTPPPANPPSNPPPNNPPPANPPTNPPTLPPGEIVNLDLYRRARSGALPKIIRTPAQLIADKMVLPIVGTTIAGDPPLPSYVFKPLAWKDVGLMPSMPGTGERQEIGIVTQAIAEWLTGGSPNNMLVQAEAHGSVPVHMTVDGHVIDVLKYPMATFDYRAKANGWTPNFDISMSPVVPEIAHYPNLNYVAYLATGDLYYLEELQFAASAAITSTPPGYAEGKGIVYPWQTRSVVWGIALIFAAWVATPEGDLPAPLLPKSYWKKLLDNNRDTILARWVRAQTHLTNAALNAYAKNTGTILWADHLAPWQSDFLGALVGFMVWTGRANDWREIYDFICRQALQRATGPLRSQAIQYSFADLKGQTDWPSLLDAHGIKATADGNFPASVKSNNPHYPNYLRANLKLMAMNGEAEAQEPFAYVDDQCRRQNYLALKWAV